MQAVFLLLYSEIKRLCNNYQNCSTIRTFLVNSNIEGLMAVRFRIGPSRKVNAILLHSRLLEDSDAVSKSAYVHIFLRY